MAYVAPLSLLSATVVLDSSLEGWSLLDPSTDGARAFRYHVSFSRPFSAPPVVQVGIVGLDVSREDNVRVRVRALDITATGFTLEAVTWLNTKIWAVDVSWLAIGS
ncbi:MAG TPA: H-type lectin domain-containing protein [Polyangiaceae bacterium]|nr:H-type lectin domain-containing protein [Polyangiaceae bacterium]